MVIKDVEENQLIKIVKNIVNLYSELYCVNGIQVLNNESNTFLIYFSTVPDFEIFCYFVNYIKYPEGVTVSPNVKGYYKQSIAELNHNFNDSRWLVVYVSVNDKDYDNCNVLNSQNIAFVYDFGGRIKSAIPEFKYQVENINKEDFLLVKNMKPETPVSSVPWWKFW